MTTTETLSFADAAAAAPTNLNVGSLATVTYTSPDGHTFTWHGQFDGLVPVEVLLGGYNDRPMFVLGTRANPHPNSVPFFALRPTVDRPFRPHGLHTDALHNASTFNLIFQVGASGWNIEPITADGIAWIDANESAQTKFDRILDDVRDTNPNLARRLDDVVYRLRQDERANAMSNRDIY